MKKLILLGASGSIGQQTIEIIKLHRNEFDLVGFSVGKRTESIADLIASFSTIKYITVQEKSEKDKFQAMYPNITFDYGDEGLLNLVDKVDCDMVVNALVGFVGFLPTIHTIKKGVDLALANKESLVVGGELVNKLLSQSKSKLYPIDSEHVALDKCLHGNKNVERLILTASGGSFRDLTRNQLHNITVEDALKHPSWKMGAKITIDCATMMNKGFEIIEAYHLFHFPLSKIDVLIHDESCIHSLIEFEDGSYLADIGPADMRIPISYALFQKERTENKFHRLKLEDFGVFHFRKFDSSRYPCVSYAKEALDIGGTMPAVLNAANETAVYAFLNKEISFLRIEEIIYKTMKLHKVVLNPSIEDIVVASKWAIETAKLIIKEEF